MGVAGVMQARGAAGVSPPRGESHCHRYSTLDASAGSRRAAFQGVENSVGRSLKDLCGRGEEHIIVERKDRSGAASVAEVSKIGTRRAGGINIQHRTAPVGVHVMLAVRGLDDDCVEVLRVLAE